MKKHNLRLILCCMYIMIKRSYIKLNMVTVKANEKMIYKENIIYDHMVQTFLDFINSKNEHAWIK